MTVEEIKHLGNLSRLSLSDDEAANFSHEIESILSYVGTVSAIAGNGSLPKVVGKVHNILRDDEVTNEPNSYTEALLAEAPRRNGRFVEVMKVIEQDE